MKRSATYGISGKEIAAARKAAGLTQRGLACAASLHVNSIKRLERFPNVPLSSSHAIESVKAHLPTLSLPVRRFTILATKPKPIEPVQILEPIHTRASSGLTPKPVRKVDRPKCGARTRKGSPCQAPSRANGRCRMHGGLSTGPKTAEGRARIADAQRRRWQRGVKIENLNHRIHLEEQIAP